MSLNKNHRLFRGRFPKAERAVEVHTSCWVCEEQSAGACSWNASGHREPSPQSSRGACGRSGWTQMSEWPDTGNIEAEVVTACQVLPKDESRKDLRTKRKQQDFVPKQFYMSIKENSKLVGQTGGYTYS